MELSPGHPNGAKTGPLPGAMESGPPGRGQRVNPSIRECQWTAKSLGPLELTNIVPLGTCRASSYQCGSEATFLGSHVFCQCPSLLVRVSPSRECICRAACNRSPLFRATAVKLMAHVPSDSEPEITADSELEITGYKYEPAIMRHRPLSS